LLAFQTVPGGLAERSTDVQEPREISSPLWVTDYGRGLGRRWQWQGPDRSDGRALGEYLALEEADPHGPGQEDRDERDLRSVDAADGITARRVRSEVLPFRIFRGYAQLGGAGMPPAESPPFEHDTWGVPHPESCGSGAPARTAGVDPKRSFAYSMTSSARASSVGGISRLSAPAVLRLIARENLVGCSIGRSATLAPFSNLSTK
jgi:hypothetical protein